MLVSKAFHDKILLYILFFDSLISSCVHSRYIQIYWVSYYEDWVMFTLAVAALVWVSNITENQYERPRTK